MKTQKDGGADRVKPKRIAQVSKGEGEELTRIDIAVNRAFGEGLEGFRHRRRPEDGGRSEDHRQKRENRPEISPALHQIIQKLLGEIPEKEKEEKMKSPLLLMLCFSSSSMNTFPRGRHPWIKELLDLADLLIDRLDLPYWDGLESAFTK
ncbi:mannitol-1-phosphate 5-dehydrogenase [Striga asiatica]|uniref:Mannitol-1-phosphate 5-dehydrogenase n=1 Tax=Striga asiatica TaxID=4170 RepID=A0A5A7Q9Z4_STRAF|nr:mannitol-1-phosphate 5-dehydrogenase [Striga asiatica]